MSVGVGTKLVGKLHGRIVHGRRVSILSDLLAAQLSSGQHVLDIGCGDGGISSQIMSRLPGMHIQGIEVQPRPDCAIPCQSFNGESIGFPDASFDVCMLVDVLHHTGDPMVLLREACRVSRSFVLIKDHLAENSLDHFLLRAMDWVGNRPHGVSLTYNYWSRLKWDHAFAELALQKKSWITELPSYPGAAGWLSRRHLHFVSLLSKQR